MTRTLSSLTIVLLTLTLVACSTSKDELKAGMSDGQSTAKSMAASDEAKTVKAVATEQPVLGAIDGVEIAGYCPVAYVAANKPVKGSADYVVEQDGMTYWFVNEDAKAAYEATPEKFAVKYQGWCATGLSMGQKIPSDPEVFAVHNGKIYLFSTNEAREAFLQSPDQMVTAADATWDKM